MIALYGAKNYVNRVYLYVTLTHRPIVHVQVVYGGREDIQGRSGTGRHAPAGGLGGKTVPWTGISSCTFALLVVNVSVARCQ
jgi:hypothetical protein